MGVLDEDLERVTGFDNYPDLTDREGTRGRQQQQYTGDLLDSMRSRDLQMASTSGLDPLRCYKTHYGDSERREPEGGEFWNGEWHIGLLKGKSRNY